MWPMILAKTIEFETTMDILRRARSIEKRLELDINLVYWIAATHSSRRRLWPALSRFSLAPVFPVSVSRRKSLWKCWKTNKLHVSVIHCEKETTVVRTDSCVFCSTSILPFWSRARQSTANESIQPWFATSD